MNQGLSGIRVVEIGHASKFCVEIACGLVHQVPHLARLKTILTFDTPRGIQGSVSEYFPLKSQGPNGEPLIDFPRQIYLRRQFECSSPSHILRQVAYFRTYPDCWFLGILSHLPGDSVQVNHHFCPSPELIVGLLSQATSRSPEAIRECNNPSFVMRRLAEELPRREAALLLSCSPTRTD